MACGDYEVRLDLPNAPALSYQGLLLETAVCPAADSLPTAGIQRRITIEREALALGRLGRHARALVVVGRDDACRVGAYGCTVLRPKPGRTATVDVQPITGQACSAEERCVARRCESSFSDAGIDGTVDGFSDGSDGADAPDAGMLRDAGPQAPACSAMNHAVSCDNENECAPPFALCVANRCEASVGCLQREVDFADVAAASILPAAQTPDGVGSELLLSGTDRGNALHGALIDFTDTRPVSPVTIPLPVVQDGVPMDLEARDEYRVARFAEGDQIIGLFDPPSFLPTPSIQERALYPYEEASWARLTDVAVSGPREDRYLVWIATGWSGPIVTTGGAVVGSLRLTDPTTNLIADVNANPVQSVVATESHLVALHHDDGRISIFDAEGVAGGRQRLPMPTTVRSDIAPGWTTDGRGRFLLATTETGGTFAGRVRCQEDECATEGGRVRWHEQPVTALRLLRPVAEGHRAVWIRQGRLALVLVNDALVPLAEVPLSADGIVVQRFSVATEGTTTELVAIDSMERAHVYQVSVRTE